MFHEVYRHVQHNQRLLSDQLKVVPQLILVTVLANYVALREFCYKCDKHVQQRTPTMSLVGWHPISLSQISPLKFV